MDFEEITRHLMKSAYLLLDVKINTALLGLQLWLRANIDLGKR